MERQRAKLAKFRKNSADTVAVRTAAAITEAQAAMPSQQEEPKQKKKQAQLSIGKGKDLGVDTEVCVATSSKIEKRATKEEAAVAKVAKVADCEAKAAERAAKKAVAAAKKAKKLSAAKAQTEMTGYLKVNPIVID